MSRYLDNLETRSPEAREAALLARLPAHVAHAKSQSSWYAERLAKVESRAIDTRAALAELPVVRKHQLLELQKAMLPFGGLNATPLAGLGRVFSSPGPIYDPEGKAADWWRFGRSLYAAGFRAGDLVHNTFAYHFTPAGFMLDGAARKLGCPVFPAGVGQTEMQVQAIADLKPTAYTGTPSFLKIILDKAGEMKVDVSSLKKAVVSGEAFFPAQKQACAERGIDAYQAYASADLGLIAYETEAREGLVLDEDLILEIVRPGTAEVLPAGEVGEIVVTSFNPDYPLIRFGTGDLSAILPGASPCGRTNVRIKGWMGRADQTTKIKGMFVHPEQVDAVVKRHPEIARARLVVTNADGNDLMTLHCEATPSDGLKAAIADSIRDVTKLRGEVAFAAPGSLPNDGKVIADDRKYD
jgi:phenylacetate-CoA ligase